MSSFLIGLFRTRFVVGPILKYKGKNRTNRPPGKKQANQERLHISVRLYRAIVQKSADGVNQTLQLTERGMAAMQATFRVLMLLFSVIVLCSASYSDINKFKLYETFQVSVLKHNYQQTLPLLKTRKMDDFSFSRTNVNYLYFYQDLCP